ncbi:MAG: hypothetical protein EHM23_14905 [Acidobacteria bacterium]|nr:MAG: hypothetical protein EHM23_14905 [Acidobacteriota bacterium]
MRIPENRIRSSLGVAIVVSLILVFGGCTQRLGRSEPETAKVDSVQTVESLAKHYRDYHDYYSLTRLLPDLELRRRQRSDVERLLGQPFYSPMPHLSYYPTDRTLAITCPDGSVPEEESCITKDSKRVSPVHSFPVVLVVAYLESEGQPRPEDRLDSISLGPVGE